MKQQFSKVRDQVEEVRGQIGQVECRISSKMEERIGEVKGQIGEAEKRIGVRIEGMESRLAAQMQAMLETLSASRAGAPRA